VRVETHNDERTIHEMHNLFMWCMDHFGYPGAEPGCRWWYGKEPDWVGSTICSGPFDIEWIDFYDAKDATVFLLRWS
jgi:hypothetical protein